MICRDEKGWYLYMRLKDGGEDVVNFGGLGFCFKFSKVIVYYYIYGGLDLCYDSENFFIVDMRYVDWYVIDGYVGMFVGNLKYYNYFIGKDVVIGKVKIKWDFCEKMWWLFCFYMFWKWECRICMNICL